MATRSHGFLITGTDTGVGKTFVGCGLALALRRRGLRVAPFKPAETGCEWDEASKSLIPSDAVLLRNACGTEASLETICPLRFRAPVAPWVAAQQEGREIEPSLLTWNYEQLSAQHDIVIVESAGGILVPIGERYHYGDLARSLNLPVLVVAASKLGVINHTLLTLEYLRSAGLKALGVVLNHPSEAAELVHEAAVQTNERTLRSIMPVRVYSIPHCSEPATLMHSFDALAADVMAELQS